MGSILKELQKLETSLVYFDALEGLALTRYNSRISASVVAWDSDI